jgi:Tfp pilus assembly protein PilO
MNFITPIILIILSVGTFFMYVDPNYRGQNLGGDKHSVLDLQKEEDEYQSSIKKADAIREKRQVLMDKQSQINPDSLANLVKLLPDNIDNIKLVINLNQIAKKHNLTLKNIKLDTSIKTNPNKLGVDISKYGTVGLSFSVSSSYDNFQNFLTDLEKSLRLVEITDLSVTGNDTGIYDFSVGIKTYWLK